MHSRPSGRPARRSKCRIRISRPATAGQLFANFGPGTRVQDRIDLFRREHESSTPSNARNDTMWSLAAEEHSALRHERNPFRWGPAGSVAPIRPASGKTGGNHAGGPRRCREWCAARRTGPRIRRQGRLKYYAFETDKSAHIVKKTETPCYALTASALHAPRRRDRQFCAASALTRA
jgi:hypothetical protein